MTLSVNSRNLQQVQEKIAEAGRLIGILDEKGQPRPAVKNAKFSAESAEYFKAIININTTELRAEVNSEIDALGSVKVEKADAAARQLLSDSWNSMISRFNKIKGIKKLTKKKRASEAKQSHQGHRSIYVNDFLNIQQSITTFIQNFQFVKKVRQKYLSLEDEFHVEQADQDGRMQYEHELMMCKTMYMASKQAKQNQAKQNQAAPANASAQTTHTSMSEEKSPAQPQVQVMQLPPEVPARSPVLRQRAPVPPQPSLWNRFKTKFNRNRGFRYGIYALIGAIAAVLTVVTVGAAGVGVGVAFTAIMGTSSVSAGSITAGVFVTASMGTYPATFSFFGGPFIKKCIPLIKPFLIQLKNHIVAEWNEFKTAVAVRWNQFKTEFNRNRKLRYGIYGLIGVAIAVTTVLTMGLAGAGIAAAFASVVGGSVTSGAVGAGVVITVSSGLMPACMLYMNPRLAAALTGMCVALKNCLVGCFSRRQRAPLPVRQDAQVNPPLVGGNPHHMLASAEGPVQQEMKEGKALAAGAGAAAAQQKVDSGCGCSLTGLFKVAEAVNAAPIVADNHRRLQRRIK